MTKKSKKSSKTIYTKAVSLNKTVGKSKPKKKATKKLKALVSQAHPVPETFLQKLYNKITKCQRLLSVKDSVTEFYRSGVEKCKKLF